MKAVILAGGLGTRISEETHLRPKPMVEIGGHPLLWHIMKIYSFHGINDFIICCGYKGFVIKEYFTNYMLHSSDIRLDMANGTFEVLQKKAEPWKITFVDTGQATMTGGRLLRVRKYLDSEKNFCFTYGDGLADVDIAEKVEYHLKNRKSATVCAVQPPGRYGSLELNKNLVVGFSEKPAGDGGFINGGFFVLNESVFDLIEGDHTHWERGPMETLARNKELTAFYHTGFWHAMDTLRDKNHLEELWSKEEAPWKVWS